MDNNSFEKFPGETAPTESEIQADKWQNAMSDGVPEFAGDVSVPVGGAETVETAGASDNTENQAAPDTLKVSDTPDGPQEHPTPPASPMKPG